MKRWIGLAVALAATIGLCSTASAQMFDGFLTNPGTGMLDTLRFNSTFWAPLGERSQEDGDGPTKRPQETQPPKDGQATASPTVLSFVPNLAVRNSNLAGFIAKTRAQSPESADQMQQLFASTDIFRVIEQALAPTGLRVDNIADAYAVYWISAWEASRGIVGSDTSREQAQGVKAQVSRALLATPAITTATPAQKQELAEALLIQTVLISASAEAAAGDPAQLAAVGKAVRQGASAMGLDLDEMELGPAGFAATK
jgi:hypothetical protein